MYVWGWRRLIGCLNLQVIFRKRATDYRTLLRKMTYEDKASYDSTPPFTATRVCTYMYSYVDIYESLVFIKNKILLYLTSMAVWGARTYP